MALGVLRDSAQELRMTFLDDIFDVAAHLHRELERARSSDRWTRGGCSSRLAPLIAARLDAPEADYVDYQRIAEALQQWDQLAHLDALVARARQSSDPDILEVAEDFQRYDRAGHPIEGESQRRRDPVDNLGLLLGDIGWLGSCIRPTHAA